MNQRYRAIDVYRGIVILIMILVNSTGKSTTVNWLNHSAWDGCTLADMVFPFFLIAVGMSSVLKYSHYQPHVNSTILKRGLWLFILGISLNAFLKFNDLEHLRIMGVLQRIAICYLITSFLCLHTTYKFQMLLIILLLLGSWQFQALFPTTEQGIYLEQCLQNSIGCIDKILLTPNHLYQSHFDPEGLMTTIPAIATTLIGNLIAYRLLSTESKIEIVFSLFAAGSIACFCSYSWSLIYPFNKSLWTGSFVLWTGGWALIFFGLCILAMESKTLQTILKPFEKLGQHSLLIFVLHVIGLKLQYQVHIHAETLHEIAINFFNSISFDNRQALYFSLSYALFWLVFAQVLPRPKKKSL